MSLRIFNVLGELIAELVDGTEDAGFKSVEWNAAGASSGVYFYRLQAGSPSALGGGGFVETKKMLLIR